MTKSLLDKSAQKIGLNLSSPDIFHLENNCIQNTPPKTDEREVISYKEAVKKHPEAAEKSWSIISADKDETTKAVFHAKDTDGYFIRGHSQKKPARETTPVNVTTCLTTSEDKFTQNVHNIVIAEENSNMAILTGCLTPFEVENNLHKGITEIFVEKNATLTFTMIHAWNPGSVVYPRTAVSLAEGAKFISNYVLISPVQSLNTNPQIYLEGEGSQAVLNSFLYSYDGGDIDVGGTIHLRGKGGRGTINSSVVCNGGRVINRGQLIGEAEEIYAHLECNAIILEPSLFEAIPILTAKLPNLDMSHEASVGKINQDEIEYLQSKGLSAETAQKLIVGGFIDDSMEKLDLPISLDVAGIVQMSKEGM